MQPGNWNELKKHFFERSEKRFHEYSLPVVVLVILQAGFLLLLKPAHAQDLGPRGVGVVYYADGPEFKALAREVAPQSGRRNYSARVKGPHSAVRLTTDRLQQFRVCGVDPSRYKLYTFRSEGNFRTITIAKINIWIGGSKSTLSESEVPVTIQSADADCFTITPKEPLKDGEYGFSPAGAEDVFMFGVGDAAK